MSSASGASNDDTFEQNLDVLVGKLSKRFRFATPVPLHLREACGPSSHLDAVQSLAAPRTKKVDEARVARRLVADQVNREVAEQECIAAVPSVPNWLRKLRTSRSDGTQALDELNALSDRLQSLADIAKAVKEQSDNLSANASTLMVRKSKLEHVQEALQQMIRKFTKVEDLVREAEHPLLSAASARFPVLLEEMEDTMQFLSEHHTLKSAKPYAAKLALAQQRALICLRDAVCATFVDAQMRMCSAACYAAAFRDKANIPLTAPVPPALGTASATNSAPISHILTAEVATDGVELGALRALLATLNDTYLQLIDGAPTAQRRLVEARCIGLEEDVHLADVLAAYRESRGRILFPLLRDWLAAIDASVAKSESSLTSLASFAQAVCSFLKDVLSEEKALFDKVWLREDIEKTWGVFVTEIGEQLYHAFRSNLLQTDQLSELAEDIDVLRDALAENFADDASAEYAALVRRMMQDSQERIVFRTSVFLRKMIGGRSITSADVSELLLHLGRTLTPPDSEDEVPVDVVLHPCMQSCLELLTTLYRAVERNVFAVFAEEGIHMTLMFFTKLTKQMLSAASSSGKTHGPLLVNLYHLKHLLVLREVTSKFDVNLSSEEKTLDLSQLAQRKIEILQSSREARKDIENDMRKSCEDIIAAAAAEVVRRELDPASGIAWIDQVMARFIESPSTRSVLLRPVQARLAASQAAVETVQPKEGTAEQAGKSTPATAAAPDSSTPAS